MKTNVPIELSDEERNQLACILDGKPTKRLVTRAEVVELATRAVEAALVGGPGVAAPAGSGDVGSQSTTPDVAPAATAVVDRDLSIPCERPTTEKDFPGMLADWYTRAKQDDPYLHAHIIWDAEKRGIKVQI